MGILAQVVIPRRSGLAKDDVVNTFAIGGVSSSVSSANLTAISGAIQRVYNGVTTESAGASFARLYMAGCLSNSASASVIKFYDLAGHFDGSPHGSPFATRNWTLDTFTDAGSLPSEVCCVATLEAVGRGNQLVERPDGIDPGFAPDRPRTRYTGRVYIGPLRDSSDVTTLDTNKEARVSAALNLHLRKNIKGCAEDIYAVNPLFFLGVWSRADEAIRAIDNVAVDDAFDTQRRRGAQPLVRTRTAISEGTSVELAA